MITTAMVRWDDTVGSFCQRYNLSRDDLFVLNEHLEGRRATTREGLWTAQLHEGEELVIDDPQVGVGAVFGVLCSVNQGKGGWQKGPDGRWYYAHHTNLLLGNLAKEYTGDSKRAQQIYYGSKERGLLPPGSTMDNVPILVGGQRTLFWMPDDAIQNALSKGCIPDQGVLGGNQSTQRPSSGTLVVCAVDKGQGGWSKGGDGRWYYVHHKDLILSALAERYLGDANAWHQIYDPSKAKGLLPPNSTPDKVDLVYQGKRTQFWMPDQAILRAYNDMCIPDTGNLTGVPPQPAPGYCDQFGAGTKPIWSETDQAWECPGECRPDEERGSDGFYCFCKPGTVRQNPSDPNSPCVPIQKPVPASCPAGQVKRPDGSCGPSQPAPVSCPSGQEKGPDGKCHPKPATKTCKPNQTLDAKGNCIDKSNNDKPTVQAEEKKAPIWPWVLGGGVVVAGGAYLATRPSIPSVDGEDDKKKKAPKSNPTSRSKAPPQRPAHQATGKLGYKHNPIGMPSALKLW